MNFDLVLLIDDDPIYNLIHERILHHTNKVSEMKSVSSGKEAIAYLKDISQLHARLPALILLDLDMPVMDGFQFMKAFYNMGLPGVSDIPIIMVTSSDHPDDRTKAILHGIKHYLIKPVAIDTMNSTLANVQEELRTREHD